MLFQKVLQGNDEKRGFLSKAQMDSTGKKEMYVRRKKGQMVRKTERSDSHRHTARLLPPICRSRMSPSGRASLCTSFRKLQRGSLTLETAMVMPLFLLGMTAMISLMDVYRLQTEHLVKLCEKAKEAGMYAYTLDGSGMEEITLPDFYRYEPVGGIAPLPAIPLHTVVKVHAWTGREAEIFQDSQPEEEEEMVFVTESGSVYHRDAGCRYLNPSVSQVGGNAVKYMTNSSGKHYQACEICSRGQSPAGTVYVTSSGNRYHNLESCSGLKRSVKLIKRSQAEGMAACSRCG